MKCRTWFYLLLAFATASVAQTKVDVISVQRPITLQEYERLTEENFIQNHAGQIKNFNLTFKHLYQRTANIKLDGNVNYNCQLNEPKPEGHCILTTHYYIDPDCWACQNVFEQSL